MIPLSELTEQDKNRHKRILDALTTQGKTFASVAEAHGKTKAYVRNVSRGHFFVRGIARILAKEAGIPVDKLWPAEFVSNGVSKKKRSIFSAIKSTFM